MSIYPLVKRAVGFTASLAAIIVTLPFWIIAVIGIEISDPGPVFYMADRVGYKGKEFTMFKFRSMRVARTKDEKSEAGFRADSKRIFAFGAFMRKTKIDELPQLLNVFIGNMAFVGPRPAAKDQAKITRGGKYAVANTVKPGLTGPAALYDYIYGDSVEDPEKYELTVLPTRLELEAYYPGKMSAAYDLKMIWYTVVCICCSVAAKRPEKILAELISAVETPTAAKEGVTVGE